jgi:hypothetical protein
VSATFPTLIGGEEMPASYHASVTGRRDQPYWRRPSKSRARTFSKPIPDPTMARKRTPTIRTTYPAYWFDMVRVENGLIQEHRDAAMKNPPAPGRGGN